jgi:hypothetical protein
MTGKAHQAGRCRLVDQITAHSIENDNNRPAHDTLSALLWLSA